MESADSASSHEPALNVPAVETSPAIPELDAPSAGTQAYEEPAAPTESVEPAALTDGPSSDALHGPAPQGLPERSENDSEAAAFAAERLDDEQAAPIAEEQIWSGPDSVDPSARTRDFEQAPLQADLGPSGHEPGAGPEPDGGRHASSAVFVEAPLPAIVEPARSLSSVSAPPASAPYANRARDALDYLRTATRILAVTVLTLVAIALLLVVLYRWVDPPASTLMVGQRLLGTEIEQKWVPIDRISPNLVRAVILSEDGAFCRHRGVDWSALEEAIESSRGGSTITMQVVKNLFLWPQRSYIRKVLEIALAYLVEVVWPKERIMEIYLNIAEWGPGVFGAEAAARHHFGKAASRLTAQEAALLAVSLPSPIERQASYPGWQMRRLADNLLIRMRAVRTVQQCVRVRRGGE